MKSNLYQVTGSEPMLSIPTYNFSDILFDADALLVVPPFARIENSSLALHILQACARQTGHTVGVFYANLAMAEWIQEEIYRKISENGVLGETIFARQAHGEGITEFFKRETLKECIVEAASLKEYIPEIERSLDKWIAALMNEVLRNNYKVIGFTTSFEQVNASIAMINYAKQIHPELITIMGGANCHDVLAEGMLLLSANTDYVFSGESEIVFPEFLEEIKTGILPKSRIIQEKICDLNKIPVPDYSEYIQQLRFFLPKYELTKNYNLVYETSRGCWWGKKHRCNFCGTYGVTEYREKNPKKVIQDINQLTRSNNLKRISMADSILPSDYMKSLFPSLAKDVPDLNIFYDLKTNTTFEQLLIMREAGMQRVLAGIESLSSSLLKRMNKGVLARQNIAFLRNCISLGINCYWDFLYGFPNDIEEDYRAMQPLLPFILHLHPPGRYNPIYITRFSPYYDCPEKFGINKIKPSLNYLLWFPLDKVNKIASCFEGDYECFSKESNPIMQQILLKIDDWKSLWEKNTPPQLKIILTQKNQYLLIDTRGLGKPMAQTISEQQAKTVLYDRPMDPISKDLKKDIEWALENNLIVVIDSWYISLVTANSELIIGLKKKIGEDEDIVQTVSRS
jgi:ribosomal peptide maturation radical SAM protein 1